MGRVNGSTDVALSNRAKALELMYGLMVSSVHMNLVSSRLNELSVQWNVINVKFGNNLLRKGFVSFRFEMIEFVRHWCDKLFHYVDHIE